MKILTWDERIVECMKKLQQLPIEHFTTICKLAISLFVVEKQSRRRLTKAAAACGWSNETMEQEVLAMSKVLMDAAQADLSDAYLQFSIKGLGLPENHVDVLTSLYNDHKDSIKSNASRPTCLNLPVYQNLDWRVDLELSTRFLQNQPKPIVTLRLDTIQSPSLTSTNPSASTTCLRVDYPHLKHMQQQLEAALREVDSVHCARIQRYMQ